MVKGQLGQCLPLAAFHDVAGGKKITKVKVHHTVVDQMEMGLFNLVSCSLL